MLGFSHRSLANFLFWVTQKKWFLITMMVGIILMLLPTPGGLTLEGYRIIIIVITALMLIVTEPIPLPAIAIYILVTEVYFGIRSANDIAKSFMNDAVFLSWDPSCLQWRLLNRGGIRELHWELLN